MAPPIQGGEMEPQVALILRDPQEADKAEQPLGRLQDQTLKEVCTQLHGVCPQTTLSDRKQLSVLKEGRRTGSQDIDPSS